MERLEMPGLIARCLSVVAFASPLAYAEERPEAAQVEATPLVQSVTVSASAPAARQQHCWKEYPTGSHFPMTRCEAFEDAISPAEAARLRDVRAAISHDDNLKKAPGNP